MKSLMPLNLWLAKSQSLLKLWEFHFQMFSNAEENTKLNQHYLGSLAGKARELSPLSDLK